MIQYLKSENEKLHEQNIHFQKLLAEENQKSEQRIPSPTLDITFLLVLSTCTS